MVENKTTCLLCVVITRLTPATLHTAKAVQVFKMTMVVKGMTNTTTVSM